MAARLPSRRRFNPWPWLGALGGLLALAWVLRDLDLDRFLAVVGAAQYAPLLALPVLIAFEQLIRAFKWRQLLSWLKPVGVWRLFGAIMVGYLSNFVMPVRVSPLVRAWLVARFESMRLSTVLATIAVDRVIDGFVFVGFTALAIAFVRFPEEGAAVRQGLAWGGAASLIIFSALVAAFVALRRAARRGSALPDALLRRLPERLGRAVDGFAVLFAEGIGLPPEPWRRIAVVAASLVMKMVAALQLAVAGLAFGVTLAPMQYVFIMVFLGFLIILAGTLRIVGGFTAGAVFVLTGFGVGVETALAMAVTVQAASLLTLAATGALALWIEGINLGEIRARAAEQASSRQPAEGGDAADT